MRGKHWLKVTLLSAAVTAALPPVRAWAQPGPAESSAAIAQREFEQLRATLADRERPQRERDEAAKRLFQRQANEALQNQANEVLLEALRSGRPDLQVPVARALADTDNPPAGFLDDLMRCLAPRISDQLAQAASFAIANYRENPAARARLYEFILSGNIPEPHKLSAIKALGTLNDQDTARFLVETVLRGTDARITPRLSDAAADALVDMTGLTEFGRDMGQWERWWAVQRTRSPREFTDDLRAQREGKDRQLIERLRQLAIAIDESVKDEHQRIPDVKERDAYILRYLKNAQPEYRASAAGLVNIEQNNGRTVGPAIVERLRDLIGDSSPDVRRKVAGAIAAINDPAAAKLLLAQLQREGSQDVKAALIDALAPTKNVAAAPDLVKFLEDPSLRVAEAAARALAELGPEIAKNPDLTRTVSNALARTIERTNIVRGTARLREYAVKAMVALKDPALVRNTLFPLLEDREANTPNIRVAAIRALSAMNVPDLQADIAGRLADTLRRDPEKGVRLEAANALGIVGSPAQKTLLYEVMNGTRESDEAVRDAAWKSLSSLFDQFDIKELNTWGEQNFRDAPDKRLTVYLALNNKLIPRLKQGNADAQEITAQELAIAQEVIGTLYIKIDKPTEAIPYLEGALAYWDAKQNQNVRIANIQIGLMEALLHTKKYKDAVVFATGRIANQKQNEEDMGRAILKEIDRLDRANDLRSAIDLLTEAKNLQLKEGSEIRAKFLDRDKEIRSRNPAFFDWYSEWWNGVVA